MNIPSKLLRTLGSKGYTPKYKPHMTFFSTHQATAKKILNHIQKSPSPKNFKKNVFKWFRTLDIPSRVKVCSTNAYWLIEVLHQALTLHKHRNMSIRLLDNSEINRYFTQTIAVNLGDKELDENEDEIAHFSDYFAILDFARPKITSEREKLENTFINQIRYLSLQSKSSIRPPEEIHNNVITLSYSFLSDFDTVEKTFMTISDGDCFKDFPSLVQSAIGITGATIFNYTLPKWIVSKPSFSMGELMVSLFEMNIMLNYYFSITYKTLCMFDYYESIDEMYTMNKELIKYITESDQNNDPYGKIDWKVIADYIRRDDDVKEIMNKRVKDDNWIYERMYGKGKPACFKKRTVNEMVNDANIKLFKVYQTNKVDFIEMLSCINDEIVFTHEDFIRKKVYEQINKFRENEIFSELINTILVDGGKKKKKKHNKKKKKKANNNEIVENNNINNSNNSTEQGTKTEENIAKNSQDNSKVEVKLLTHISNKNQIDFRKNDVNTFNKRTNNFTQEVENSTIKKDNYIITTPTKSEIKKEKKKKNKGFFLYNTITKKEEHKTQMEKDSHKSEQEKENKIQMESEIKSQPEKEEPKTQHDSSSPTSTSSTISLQTNLVMPSMKTTSSSSIMVTNTGTFQFITPSQNSIQTCPLIDQLQQTLTPFSNEICYFIGEIEFNKSQILPYKDKILSKIISMIRSTLKLPYLATKYVIEYYGSYMTGLSIENSDIDIMIKVKDNKAKSKIISLLLEKFSSETKLFENSNPILTASVPVIKLQSDISKLMSEETKNKFIFYDNKDDIYKAKFDISFIQTDDMNSKLPSQLIIDFIKEQIVKYPSIKSLMYILKKYFNHIKLNSTYNGGLSSFSLFLLVLAYLKSVLDEQIGAELYHFFIFYANFDFTLFNIDVLQENPFVLRETQHNEFPQIVILDPLTGFNVAKSSYKIDEIKFAFVSAANYLHSNLITNNTNRNVLNGLFSK